MCSLLLCEYMSVLSRGQKPPSSVSGTHSPKILPGSYAAAFQWKAHLLLIKSLPAQTELTEKNIASFTENLA